MVWSRLTWQVARKAAKAAAWSSCAHPGSADSGTTRSTGGGAPGGPGGGPGGAKAAGPRGLTQAASSSASESAQARRSGKALRLRCVYVNEGPVGVFALQPALEGPQLGSAAVVDRLAFGTCGAAPELGQEADGHPRQVAKHLGLVEVGARLVQELDALGAAFGLARGDGRIEAGEDLRREQAAQGLAVAGGEGLDDHLVGRAGALQEVAHLEAGI